MKVDNGMHIYERGNLWSRDEGRGTGEHRGCRQPFVTNLLTSSRTFVIVLLLRIYTNVNLYVCTDKNLIRNKTHPMLAIYPVARQPFSVRNINEWALTFPTSKSSFVNVVCEKEVNIALY